MTPFLIYIYIAFCYGFTFSMDDGKKWDFIDVFVFIISPIYVPFIIGGVIGRKFMEEFKKRLEDENETSNR